ncbi:TBC1 domain family member 22B-like isoform X2 [Rhopilema esculentum]|uniref:TBC1 domain family member 22B-like isoform X2 n=1 Tax=Rhopilema esculentum TaxID=499914 RepID=UPI0031DB2734
MSETAKERVLTVGARFTSLEHTNQLKPTVSEEQRKGTTQPQTTKVAFWKKGTGASKVPGRAVYGAQHPPLHITDGALLESISKNAKARNKKQLSYQEFEGSTVDAWEDDEDEIIKLSQSPSHESYEAPVAKPQESSPARSSSTRKIDSPSHRFKEESGDRGSVGSATTKSRQPKASARNENKPLKNSIKVKQAIVSKLSETIAKATKNRFSPPPSASPEPAEIMQPPTPHSPIRQVKAELQDQESARLERFGKLLAGPTTDMDQLQKLSWNGIPNSVRPSTWRLLSGYLPPSIDRRQSTLERKRQEYSNFVAQYYPTRFDELNQETYRQISIDIPRTNPLIPIFQQRVVQEIFERVLYIWAIRHPASGYVQGINDLVVPFFITFLSEHLDEEVETYDINRVPKGILDSVEADTFWCVTKLLNGIQDNYTFAQPGIQHKINALSDLVSRIDGPLHKHIREYNIDYLQFAFRWMNNLLMRELSLRCLIRLWDTYWAEPDGFAIFHLYVCAALLTRFSKEISHMFDFQTIMRFLQDLPTRSWTEEDIAVIVAEAYRLKFVFGDAPKHLKSSSSLR